MIHFKLKKSIQENKSTSIRERLFFHDLINHTHGLILFLNSRFNSSKGIEVSEIPMLEKEIKTLQSLIKDHFHLGHKNLDDQYDWVPYTVCEATIKSLMQIYLTNSKLNFKASRKEARDQTLLYFPTFFRIINNLIKNMAEAKTDDCELVISLTNDHLLIETKNKIEDCNAQVNFMGVGLESIKYLALESGGQFTYETENGFWVNKLLLPTSVSQSIDHKKAA